MNQFRLLSYVLTPAGVYIQTVDKEYILYTDKGSFKNEGPLWHLLRKKYAVSNEDEDED